MSKINLENTQLVAVGVIFNKNPPDKSSQFLIAKRPPGKPLAGFWEFPGGKVEKNENVEQALLRELKEEIGITVLEAKPIIRYPVNENQKSVILDVWVIHKFSGEPTACEGQELQWVFLEELSNYTFPPANQEIIELLQKIGKSNF